MSNKAVNNKVFVCGGGHQGLSMAAHLALNGVEVTMWNRTAANIQEIINTHEIHCNGCVNGTAHIEAASSDIRDVISDFVMVTTPSNAHREIAQRIAPFVHKNMIIVLNPGRTFGAIEFCLTLLECGVKELPHIAETQTIVYTCRRSGRNATTIFALKESVNIAALNGSDIGYIMDMMPLCLKPYFHVVDSVAITSLSNVGMVLHCAPVLMNIGWIESDKVDFKYYYDGISISVAEFLEKLDEERVGVGKALGYTIETTKQWLCRTYEVNGESLYECIRNNEAYREIDAPPSIRTRYILEDVPNGLVAVEHLGKILGVETPCCSMIIDLASKVFGINFRIKGRRFPKEVLKKFLWDSGQFSQDM